MSRPVISVKQVSKTVAGRQLLQDVSFSVARQSLVSLIGPNGAGKSTLVKIILGLDTQYTGSVTIEPNQRVQYIPQLATNDQHQLPISVYEYISIGTTPLYSRSRKAADLPHALDHVGVD